MDGGGIDDETRRGMRCAGHPEDSELTHGVPA